MRERWWVTLVAVLIPGLIWGLATRSVNNACAEPPAHRVRIGVPCADVEISAGDSESVTLVVSRPLNHLNTTRLGFAALPAIQVEPPQLILAESASSFVTVVLRADPDAAEGIYTVEVQEQGPLDGGSKSTFHVHVFHRRSVPVDRHSDERGLDMHY